MEKQATDIMMSSIVDAPSFSLPDESGWLNWAFNANIKVKKIVLAKQKLALQALLCLNSVSNIGDPPKDSKAWLADAPPPIVTYLEDKAKMIEKFIHSKIK